jgi:hypothetical protein
MAILIGCYLSSAFAAVIIVVEIYSKRTISLEVLITLPMVAVVLLSTRPIIRLLRNSRSRPPQFT